MDPRHKADQAVICRCNSVNRLTIKDAIRSGCGSLDEIFDQTGAGVGPCGGSCRAQLRPMLEQYLKEKTFPDTDKK